MCRSHIIMDGGGGVIVRTCMHDHQHNTKYEEHVL